MGFKEPVSRQAGPRDGSFVARRPVRGFMIMDDVEDAASFSDLPRAMEFFFNPEQLDFLSHSEWAKIAIPGLSHTVLQWSHKDSDSITFDLSWSAQEALRRQRDRSKLPTDDPLRATVRRETRDLAFLYRDFLYSMTVPMERGRSPSRVTINWPNFMIVTVVVEDVDFSYTQWDVNGNPMAFDASIDVTEIRTAFKQRRGAGNYFLRPDEFDFKDEGVTGTAKNEQGEQDRVFAGFLRDD